MKEEFQKLVCDIIDKSGVEIDTEERQKIIDEAIQTALEHIATSVSAHLFRNARNTCRSGFVLESPRSCQVLSRNARHLWRSLAR